MKGQVLEAIEWGGEQSGKKPVTPASANLFDEYVSSEPLTLDLVETFHSIVQKLLYICKRVRPDLEPALLLLCTRVSKPNTDNEKKLARVLDYLKDTVDDVCIVGADSLEKLYMWVDTS